MKLQTLYSRTNTGAIQQWTLEIEEGKYRTVHGQVNGKLQTTEWTVCEGKNIGKANETTAEMQVHRDAQALWKKKCEKGYFKSIDEVDNEVWEEPMRAQNYNDRKDELVFPVYSQPKLDGIRCIIRKDGMWSRNGKKFVSAPHIFESLKDLFIANPNLRIDGELYCSKYNNDFNAICSLVKKTKPTQADLDECARVLQYWIYDVQDTSLTFKERNAVVKKICDSDNPYIVEVPTAVCDNVKELDNCYEFYVSAGFEGGMVRTNAKYEFKRSKSLLKRKEFQDKEYVILDVIEGVGNRTGGAGAMRFTNEQGREFTSNITGNRSWCAQLLRDKDLLIGKQATVKFFNLTPDNVPRFPHVIAIRDYE